MMQIYAKARRDTFGRKLVADGRCGSLSAIIVKQRDFRVEIYDGHTPINDRDFMNMMDAVLWARSELTTSAAERTAS